MFIFKNYKTIKLFVFFKSNIHIRHMSMNYKIREYIKLKASIHIINIYNLFNRLYKYIIDKY